MQKSTISIEEVFDEKTGIFDTMPIKKLGTHGSFKALMATLMIECFGRRKTRSKFLMLFDEIGNVGKLPSTTMTKAFSLLPGLGLRIITYWQWRAQMKLYEPRIETMFTALSSCVQAWEISEPDFAKEMSRLAGQTTKKKARFSKDPKERDFPYQKSWDEFETPVLSETEILLLPKDQQLIKMSGERMIKARKIFFWQVRTWRRLAGPNPYETGGYPKEHQIEWD